MKHAKYLVVGEGMFGNLRHSIAYFDTEKNIATQLSEWAERVGFKMEPGVVAVEVAAVAGGYEGQGPALPDAKK